jgi:hypothetical protein
MTQTLNVDIPQIVESALEVLSEREKDVVLRRFSLQGRDKETLDRIGRSYDVTRERVRQIEVEAMKKLSVLYSDPKLKALHALAWGILEKQGRIMEEDRLLSQMIKSFTETSVIDMPGIKLSLQMSPHMIKKDRNQFFRSFWRTSEIQLAEIKNCAKQLKRALKDQEKVMTLEALQEMVAKDMQDIALSVLRIDFEFKETPSGWGLAKWRDINPRSIRDKIMVTLRKHGKPMHFREVVKHVIEDFSSRKAVTAQAIHNELIRQPIFPLVGRGLYGLQEWGMASGTVADLLIEVFQEADGQPLGRKEVIDRVLEKRDIRLGTISLNLQKYDCFVRVGRAKYIYDESLDTRKRRLQKD